MYILVPGALDTNVLLSALRDTALLLVKEKALQPRIPVSNIPPTKAKQKRAIAVVDIAILLFNTIMLNCAS